MLGLPRPTADAFGLTGNGATRGVPTVLAFVGVPGGVVLSSRIVDRREDSDSSDDGGDEEIVIAGVSA